jgi:hypothetical protein
MRIKLRPTRQGIEETMIMPMHQFLHSNMMGMRCTEVSLSYEDFDRMYRSRDDKDKALEMLYWMMEPAKGNIV